MSKREPVSSHGFSVGQRVITTRGKARGETGTIEWLGVLPNDVVLPDGSFLPKGVAVARVYFAAGKLQGSTVVVRVPIGLRKVEEPPICPACDGSGKVSGFTGWLCPVCGGAGIVKP